MIEVPTIETPRLSLIAATKPILEAALRGDKSLSRILEAKVSHGWTEFGDSIFRFSLEMVKSNPSDVIWWTYLPILKAEKYSGSCGYKGPPGKAGIVEIGYEIAKTFRNQGLATELAKGLIDFAFSYPEVKSVKAHTLAEINSSGTVLTKCGMKKVEELFDPDDGEIWQWMVSRPTILNS
ncbi:MAG: GNAT family N-acetyltransferase [Saprospirales bacterium]|nr:GNAT family N-acetyltransferase [Saprospirales bacterium]